MNFTPYNLEDFSAVTDLLSKAFDTPQQSNNFSSIGRAQDSPSYLRFLAKDGADAIGYLGYAVRKLRYLGQTFLSASIGPVAVLPGVQQKGVGSFLMRETLEHMKRTGVEIVYIQGIPDYYQRFGFIKYLDKSKRIIRTDENTAAINSDLKIIEGTQDVSVYKGLHEQYSKNINFSSQRTDEDWAWLLGPGADTYYFYKPKLIQDGNGEYVGYFCDDPDVANSPREIVLKEDCKSIAGPVEALKRHYRDRNCETVELKAPESSRLVDFLDSVGCQKITFINPRGGDLMLMFDEHGVAKRISQSIAHLLSALSTDFSVDLNFSSFSMGLGLLDGKPYSNVKLGDNLSKLSLVNFISGRIENEHLSYTRVTGFNSFGTLQAALFQNSPGFVFQGDNM